MSMRSRLYERARTLKHKARERRLSWKAAQEQAERHARRWRPLETLETRILLSGDGLGGVDALNTATVEGRHLFFNNSFFDGGTVEPDPNDDNAIVPGKSPLLPGVDSAASNYSNYLRGINGIFVDISDIPDPGAIDAADFEFNIGNNEDPSTWSAAPAPSFVDVREGAGDNGSDRVTLIWADGVIRNTWMRVRVLAGDTGLASNDVFYYGNAVGDTFNSASNLFVDGSDLAGVRDNPRDFTSPADTSDPFDLNRDRFVDGTDFAIARDNPTDFATDVNRILIPFTAPAIEDLALGNDSGDLSDDGLTNDPTVGGRITNFTGAIALRAGLNGVPENQFIDISTAIQPDGTFTLDDATLEQLNGDAPLTDGAYSVQLRASSDGGDSDLVTLNFTLDQTAPTLNVQSLAQGLNVNATSRLQGAADPAARVTIEFDDGGETPLAIDPQDGSFDEALQVAALNAGSFEFTVRAYDEAGNVRTRLFNLNRTTFEIISAAPDDGAAEVGVTFRPKIFFGEPVNPASLNANNFYARAGGEKLPATIVPANEGQFAWLFFEDPMPAATTVEVTVDGSTIMSTTGSSLDADGDGEPGGVLKYSFSTVNLSPVPGTTLTGIIVEPGPDGEPFTADDVDPGPDGEFGTHDDIYLLPIAGVDVHLIGLEESGVSTDFFGRFTLTEVPGGNVKVVTDGMTATNPPAGSYFPEMVMDAYMEPGVENYIMPGHMVMYLPRVPNSILNAVDNDTGAMIVAGNDGAPNLDPDDQQRLTIEVQPNSMTAPDGTPVQNGQVGISTVPPELVVDMLPPGVLQHTFDITVQAPGIATFSDPAPMTFPNVFGAAPGTQLNFLSFDHTTGRLVIEGTATVSDDGTTVTTDAGTGITTPGWHGVTPPGTNTKNGRPSRDGNGTRDPKEEEDKGPKDPGAADITGLHAFYTSPGNKEFIQVTHTGADDTNPVNVKVNISGVDAFLDGLETSSYSFSLSPGDFEPFRLVVKEQTDEDTERLEEAELDGEILTGSIHIVATSKNKQGATVQVAEETFYFGRLLSAEGDGLVFPETLETEGDDVGGTGLDLGAQAVLNEDGTVDLRVRESGPVSFDYALNGDDRLSLEQGGADLTIKFTPDPEDETRPEGDLVATRMAEAVGTAPLNAEPPLDLDPLAIRVTDGTINKNDKGFDIAGTIEIGLSEGTFEPLATLDGSFKVTEQIIQAKGKLVTTLGPLGDITLFNGTFTIPRGQDNTDSLQDNKKEEDDGLSLAGLEVSVSDLDFDAGALTLQGSVTLPDVLGNVKISVEDDHKIVIDSDGVSVTGGIIEFPNVEFSLFNSVDVKATGLNIEYVSGEISNIPGDPDTPDQLLFRGSIDIMTSLFTANANFTPDPDDEESEAFIRIQSVNNINDPYEIDVVGELSMADVRIGPFELKSAKLVIDTVQNIIGGEATLKFPTGFDITAGVEFIDGELNMVSLGVDNINKPIGSTGAFLQKIFGSVDHLADPDPITVTGSVGVTGGPQINVPFPAFLGGSVQGSLIRVDGTMTFNSEMVKGDIVAKVLGGLANGDVSAELNWGKGYLLIEGSLGVFDNAFTIAGRIRANTNFDVSASLVASGTIPEAVPVVGGYELPQAGAVVAYSNNGFGGDDYVAVFGAIDTFAGELRGGLRVFLDGNWEFIGGDTIDQLTGSSLALALEQRKQQLGLAVGTLALDGPNAETAMFTVPAGRPWAMLAAEWPNVAPGTEIELVSPSGVTFTEADIAADPDMAIEGDLSGDTRRVVSILNPEPGEWTIGVADGTALGGVAFDAIGGNTPPTLTVTGPAADVTGGNIAIDYNATDPDDDATFELYVDDDRQDNDGLLIASGLVEADGAGQFVLDTSTLPAGEYYVYGVISDDGNAPVISNYSAGKITVVDPDAPTAVADVTARWIGDNQVELSWAEVAEADFYEVGITANAAGEAIEQTLATEGPQTTVVLNNDALETPLVAGETYRFEVRAVDELESGEVLRGAMGMPAIGIVGPAPTVVPGPGEFNVFADPDTQYTDTFEFDDGAGETIALIEGPAGATLDTNDGSFAWDVPVDAEGFFDVIIETTDSEGNVEQTRYMLFADADRLADLTGQKIQDADRSGLRDGGEEGLNGITIELVDAITGAVLDTTVTADVDLDDSGGIEPQTESGIYSFDGLTPGDYVVREVFDAGNAQFFSPTPLSLGAALSAGQTTTVDFGAPSQGSISGTVLNDTDFDGVGDVAMAGVSVFLDINADGDFDEGVDVLTTSAEDDPDTGGIDETGTYRFDNLLDQTYVVRAIAPEGFAQVDPADPPTHTFTLAVDADETGRDFVMALDPGDPATEAPSLVLTDPATEAVFDGLVNFGTVLSDGAGGDDASVDVLLENLGGRNLVISGVTLNDPSGAFAVSGLPEPTTVIPEGFEEVTSALQFSIAFDPAVHGEVEATLTLESNDPAGDVVIRLIGAGQNPDGELTVVTPNNNAGGVAVGVTENRATFMTLVNDGAGALTITDILVDGVVGVTGLPGDFPTNPIVLAPGESRVVDATFMAEDFGLRRGSITILSDDADEGAFVQPVTATGIPDDPTITAPGMIFGAGASQTANDSIFIPAVPQQVVTTVTLTLRVDIALKQAAQFTLSHGQGSVDFNLDAFSNQDLDFQTDLVLSFPASFDGQSPSGIWTLTAENLFQPPADEDAVALDDLVVTWDIEIETDTLDFGNDFIAVQTPAVQNSPIFRDITTGSGGFEFFLAAEELYQATVFDPISGKVGHFTGVTQPSGLDTFVPAIGFAPSVVADSDGDGIPDDIEHAIGTNIDVIDTDGDGIDDLSEIRQGLDPLGGLGIPIGVTSRVDLSGDALDVAVVGDTSNPERQFAFVATGEYGLGIVEVTQKTMPIIDGEVDLPGTNNAVAVDLGRGVAAVSAGADGLHLVDVTDRVNPTLRETVDLDNGAGRLTTFDGAAYVISGTAIVAIDLLTGETLDELDLAGGGLIDIAREGSRLYVVDDLRELTVIDLTIDGMSERGSRVLDGSDGNRGRLFVGNGLALINVTSGPGEGFRGSFMTVDVSDPDNPFTISGSDVPTGEQGLTLPNTEVVANGSGLAIVIGTPFATANHQLRPFNIADPLNTFDPASAPILLDVAPEGLDVAGGFGYVANGSDGLAIVNYLQLDTGGAPPTVSISTPLDDADELTDGFQVLEGANIPITVDVTDDVQVRNVELIVNGEVVINDLSFPYDLSALAEGADGGDTVTVRVRATDTGGNAALSNLLTFQTTPDVTPPTLQSTNIDGGVVGSSFKAIRLRFDEPIDPATVTPANFALRPLGGAAIVPVDLQLRSNDQLVQITYGTLAKVDHVFEINAPAITDRAGNALGADPIVQGFTISAVSGPLFPAQKFPVGQGPQEAATADLNADGLLDVVTPDDFGETVSVLFGNGDGTFRAGPTLEVDGQPTAVTLADFDADGSADIAVTLDNVDQVAVMLNDGAGGFSDPAVYAVGDTPGAIESLDVDEDGDLDLVVANASSDNLSVLFNAGDGTFTRRGDLDIDINRATIAADVNADGIGDLITPNSDDDAVDVALGNGDGTYQPARTYLVNANSPREVVAIDLDGDTDLDLVTVSQSGHASVLLGRGDGTFDAVEQLDGRGGVAAVPADLDGDGAIDLAYVSEFQNVVRVALSQGNGAFSEPVEYFAGVRPVDIHSDDVNGDGDADLLIASNTSSALTVLIGEGDGTFAAQSTVAANVEIGAAAADFNGDGKVDLATTVASANELRIDLSNGDGTYDESERFEFQAEPSVVRIADVNGDGNPDLIALDASFGELHLLTGVGDGTFSEPTLIHSETSLKDVGAADFDGDGDIDLAVLAGSFSLGQLTVLANDGAGGFTAGTPIDTPNDPLALVVRDVTGDGQFDAVVGGGQFFQELAVLTGNGDGTFSEGIVTSIGSDVKAHAVADFTGDGIDDVAIAAPNGSLSLRAGDGTGAFANLTTTAIGSGASDIALGDLDDDGNLDFVIANEAGQVLHVVPGNGDGTLGTPVRYAIGDSVGDLTLTDADGDGNLDVVSGGVVVLGNGDGSLKAPRSVALGLTPEQVTTGDFNDDGLRDYLVASVGDIRIGLGAPGGAFESPVTIGGIGGPAFGVTALDLDGDGDDDILNTNEFNGEIGAVLSNGDGTFAAPVLSPTSVGTPDRTAFGDLNNDGHVDAIVSYAGNFQGVGKTTVALLGDGAGNFANEQELGAFGFRSEIRLFDFDGDGNLDIAAADTETLELSIFRGAGDGSFMPPTPFGVNDVAAIDRVDVADFTGDGNLDIIQAQSSSSGDGWLAVGDGAGGFGFAPTYAGGTTTPTDPGQLHVGEMTGDAAVDLLIGGRVLLTGVGDGTFESFDEIGASGVDIVRFADVDNDGDQDMVYTVPGSDAVDVRLGDGAGGFADAVRFATGDQPSDLAMVDLDGDGTLDILTSNTGFSASGDTVSVMLGVGDGTFGVSTNFALSDGGDSIAIGDFDEDGNPDVAVAVPQSDAIEVLLGDGNGGLGTPTTYRVPDTPRDLAVADLDNDGHLDLAVANDVEDIITVIRGRGDGTFLNTLDFDTNELREAVALGDLDGDGNLDVITADDDGSSNQLSVRLGQGDGTVGTETLFTTGSRPEAIAVGDLNNDGDLDVVTADNTPDAISILLGNGAGGLGPASSHPIGDGPIDVRLVDIDGDGNLDLITANNFGDSLSVALGNGDGTFAAATEFAAGNSPEELEIVDLDGDTNLDLIAVNELTDNISVFLGDGLGGFGAKTDFPVGDGPQSLAIGDVDEDGNVDVVTVSRNDESVDVVLGDGAGGFGAVTAHVVGGNPIRVELADFDADGHLDVIYATDEFGDEGVAVLLGAGDGTFGDPLRYNTVLAPTGLTISDLNNDGQPDVATEEVVLLNDPGGVLAAGQRNLGDLDSTPAIGFADADEDGTLDLLIADDTDEKLVFMPGLGDGFFGTPARFDLIGGAAELFIDGLDGDGHHDVAIAQRDFSGPDGLAVLLGAGDGTFGAATRYATGESVTSIDGADVSGDGHTDLAISNGSQGIIALTAGRGDGTFIAPLNTGEPSGVRAVGDLDGDGVADRVNALNLSDQIGVRLNDGAGGFGPETTINLNERPVWIDLADLDGDGNLDIIAAVDNIFTDGTFAQVAVLLGVGDGTFAAPQYFDAGLDPQFVLVADFNEDGSPDVATANGFGDDVSVLIGNGDGTLAPPLTFAATDRANGLLATDANGDGHLDLLVASGFTNTTEALLLGNGDGTFIAPRNVRTGDSPVSMAIGDLDADGVDDVLVGMVTGGFGSGTVAALLGQAGAGLFDAPIVAGTDIRRADDVKIAEVTGDANLDAITVNNVNAELTIAPGNGDGTFGPAESHNVGSNPEAVAIADITGDGLVDLIVAHEAFGDNIVGYLEQTVGGFASFEPFPAATGDGSVDVLARDLNGDADTDLLIINADSGDVTVLLGGAGDPVGLPVVFTAEALNAQAFRVGDVNSDGVLDLVIARDGFDDLINVLLGNGDGTFNDAGTFPAGSTPQRITLRDFDGDGAVDAIVTRSGGLALLLGNDDGTFNAPIDIDVPGASDADLASADLNADGAFDIVIANGFQGTLSVLINDGSGGFGGVIDADGGAGERTVALDLNDDGVPDLATIDNLFGSGELHLALGNGDGTYAPAVTSAIGGSPTVLHAADFDEDGHDDLVILTDTEDELTVYLGNGDGTLAAPVVYDVGARAVDVTVGDVDADGHLDLVTANQQGGGTTSVLYGRGDGTFIAPLKLTFNRTASGSATGDIDNDGDLDVITANGFRDDVSISLGNGDGTFAAPTHIDIGDFNQDVVLADFNGDGNLDLAVTASSPRQVVVALGNGDGTFGAGTGYSTDFGPNALTTADLDGDGELDLAVANENGNSISIFIGAGDGTFGAATELSAGNRPVDIVAADLDDDGDLDLVVPATFTSALLIFVNQGGGTFDAAVNVPVGGDPSDVVVGDLNGDGETDFAVTASSFSGSTVSVLLGTADATTYNRTDFAAPNIASIKSAALLDADNDGDLDVAVAALSTGIGGVMINDGTGALAAPTNFFDPGVEPEHVNVADLDGDGNDDLLIGDALNFGNGDGTFTSNIALVAGLPVGNTPGRVQLADVDADGNLDIVTSAGFGGQIAAVPGNGDRTFESGAVIVDLQALIGLNATDLVAATDFTGDGAAELIVRLPADATGNQYGILRNQGDGAFDEPENLGLTIGPDEAPTIADLDADGNLDLVFGSTSGQSIAVLFGAGAGGFLAETRVNLGQTVNSVAVGDADGDGRPDLLSRVGVVLSRAGGSFATALELFIGDEIEAVDIGDIDGDGHLDLAAVNNANAGEVVVAFGAGGGRFEQPLTFDAGFRPNQIALGDLDGDGLLDIAITTEQDFGDDIPEQLRTYVNNGDRTFSPSGTMAIEGPAFGLVIADVTGDEIPDLTAYTNPTGAQVELFIGNGDGSVVGPLLYGVNQSRFDDSGGESAVADLNNNGFPDIIVANPTGLTILFSFGDTFLASDFTSGDQLTILSPADQPPNADPLVPAPPTRATFGPSLNTADTTDDADLIDLLSGGDTFDPFDPDGEADPDPDHEPMDALAALL